MGSIVTPSSSPRLELKPKKRIAVIGAGPAGAIVIDALVQEQAFDVIRVFERREAAGGCWLDDAALNKSSSSSSPPPNSASGLEPENLPSLADRTADQPVSIPSEEVLEYTTTPPPPPPPPTTTITETSVATSQEKNEQLRQESLRLRSQRASQPRFMESSIYPYLETNVDVLTMQYSQEPIIAAPSDRSVGMHGTKTPFRHWTAMREYVQRDLIARKGYERYIEFDTTVERAEKLGEEWRLVIRKEARIGEVVEDQWNVEWFDGLVVASGHFSVPYIPPVEGLVEFARSRPDGGVLHSKHFRGRDQFKGKHVVVVGASVSAADIAFDLVGTAASPVHAVMADRNPNLFFGDGAFQHPHIAKHPTILRIEVDSTARNHNTVHFIDGTSITDVDHIIFGTGYSWTAPFLQTSPSSSSSFSSSFSTSTASKPATVTIHNNRITNLYQHVISTTDPSLCFVGGVGAGLTFKIFEWQAVLAASTLSARANLPSTAEMEKWEQDRIREKGDGKGFLTIYPGFREYFDTVRELANAATADEDEAEAKEGEGKATGKRKGRPLPVFDPMWEEAFMAGHELRKDMWRRRIKEDTAKMEGKV